MKRVFTALRSLFGVAHAAEPRIETIDPAAILFSIPTLSNALPPLETVGGNHGTDDLFFHEDDWRQLEFFPAGRIIEAQAMLKALKVFSTEHREANGWKRIYVRELEAVPVVTGQDAMRALADLLDSTLGPAPILHSSNAISGRVGAGFTLHVGGNIQLYGHTDASGIPVLGASVGPDPDDTRLTDTFVLLNQAYGLVLVDWQQQFMLLSQESDGNLRVWQP